MNIIKYVLGIRSLDRDLVISRFAVQLSRDHWLLAIYIIVYEPGPSGEFKGRA